MAHNFDLAGGLSELNLEAVFNFTDFFLDGVQTVDELFDNGLIASGTVDDALLAGSIEAA